MIWRVHAMQCTLSSTLLSTNSAQFASLASFSVLHSQNSPHHDPQYPVLFILLTADARKSHAR